MQLAYYGKRRVLIRRGCTFFPGSGWSTRRRNVKVLRKAKDEAEAYVWVRTI